MKKRLLDFYKCSRLHLTERYLQRVTAKKSHAVSTDIDRRHTTSTATEEETEPDSKRENITPLTPQRGRRERFSPPSVEEVAAYCLERQNGIAPEEFVCFYASKGWRVGQSPMKSWKHAVITWEKKRKSSGKEADPYANVV